MSTKIKLTDVTPNFRDGSARAEYYAVLRKYNGKTLDSFVKHVDANPPSVPKKGKLAGKPEPIKGWISFFVRQGLLELKD